MSKHMRKDLKHDEFKETIENIIIFYEHHKKTVLWVVSGVVILLILFFTYRNNKMTKIKKSKEIYNIGVILYSNANFDEAREKFKTLADNYQGTIFANRSLFMLANMSYKEGNVDDALVKFQAFTKEKYDEIFTPSAYQGIGQCYEQKGDMQGAIKNYKTACDKFKGNVGKSDCLLSLARLYLALQKMDEAEDVLEEILDISEDTEILKAASKKIKLIQAQRELNE